MMLVVMFVAMTVNAQMGYMVYDVNYGRMEFQVGNAWYNCADVPGCTHIRPGDNVTTIVTNYFTRLRHDDPEAYQREYNLWLMRGGLAGVTPVRYSTVANNGMMMNGAMMGMNTGMMMGGMGYGMQNTGMVMGATGMAGATSNVVIDNSNLAETIGSGITMNYDTGSNSLSISGDPITAGLRLFTAIGSKTKKNRQQVVYQQQVQQPVQQQTYNGYANGQVLQDAQGNQYIVQNGQLYRLQSQQVQQPQQVRTQQVRTNTTTTRTNGSGFVTGF